MIKTGTGATEGIKRLAKTARKAIEKKRGILIVDDDILLPIEKEYR